MVSLERLNVRVMLAILIAFVQTAGSAFCYCTFALKSSPVSAASLPACCLTNAPRPLPTPEPEPVCPHCRPSPAKLAVPQASSPLPVADPVPEPTLPKHDCPCDGLQFEEAVQPKTWAQFLDLTLHDLGSWVSRSEAHPAILPTFTWPGRRMLPLLPAQDKLFVHHVLRC
jgi:hypothetical protein